MLTESTGKALPLKRKSIVDWSKLSHQKSEPPGNYAVLEMRRLAHPPVAQYRTARLLIGRCNLMHHSSHLPPKK